jgi:hypothetical protein
MLLPSLKLRSRAHTPKPLGEDGSRTVKPCGPGTRCWCQVGGGFADPTGFRKAVNSPMTVTKRNSSPGRARSKPLKPLRRECRLIPVNLWRRPCAFFCTRAAGASDTRHSLRPLFWRETIRHNSGVAPRECEGMFVVTSEERERHTFNRHPPACERPPRHCERSEAIQGQGKTARWVLDCFAEPVIGRAFARPVGSQ